MPKSKPISVLKSPIGALEHCPNGSPAYLTKNSNGKYVVIDIDEYEKSQLESGDPSDGFYTIKQLQKELGL